MLSWRKVSHLYYIGKVLPFFNSLPPIAQGLSFNFLQKGKEKSVIEKVESIEKLSALLACGLS
jgi:hypothetical protein